jgi:WD40 repeat protein
LGQQSDCLPGIQQRVKIDQQGEVHKTGRVVSTFDPQGILFAVGSDENAISLYDLRTFDRAPFLIFKFDRSPFQWKSLEFNYNGRSILGLTTDNTIFLIDSFNGTVVRIFGSFHELLVA